LLYKRQTLGQAMQSAFNKATVRFLDEGKMRPYDLQNETLYCDPALRPNFIDEMITTPASATVKDDIVTVTAPSHWTPTAIH